MSCSCIKIGDKIVGMCAECQAAVALRASKLRTPQAKSPARISSRLRDAKRRIELNKRIRAVMKASAEYRRKV